MNINPNRVGWVDYAKGFCLVMVVMMHSTLGVQDAARQASWIGAWVAFAKPFRMPDFFLTSRLFLARVIDRNWRDYLDKKVLHFAYFYALWVTIQFAFKAPSFAAELGGAGVAKADALSFIDPFGTLWFIYLLPIFFVVTKLTRDVPPVMVWFVAALLQVAGIQTSWTVIDEFCARFVYFYTGYALALYVFDFAATVEANTREALLFLAAWALFEGVMVFNGYSELPIVGLGLGFLGALAVIATSVLLFTRRRALPLSYAGQNSIVVYLAFFLPMATTRIALLRFAPGLDLGVVALVVTVVGVVTPLVLHTLINNKSLRFLFVRPGWAKLPPTSPRPAPATA
jgi:uncharacterized membrane protein YcfT